MRKKNEPVEQDITQTIEHKREENERLFDQLTSKNKEYMVKLNRQLDEGGMTEERKTAIYNDMLKTIVEQQANHLTARKIYGTTTDQAIYLLEGKGKGIGQEEQVVQSEPWKIYLDGSLLLGGMFALITGVSYLFGNETAGLGLITLILNFLLSGLAIMVITKYAPQPGVKGGFLKYVLATTLTMIAWIIVMSFGTVLFPASLNIFIPGLYTLIIGIAAFGLRWYLKKKLNIQGTLL